MSWWKRWTGLPRIWKGADTDKSLGTVHADLFPARKREPSFFKGKRVQAESLLRQRLLSARLSSRSYETSRVPKQFFPPRNRQHRLRARRKCRECENCQRDRRQPICSNQVVGPCNPVRRSPRHRLATVGSSTGYLLTATHPRRTRRQTQAQFLSTYKFFHLFSA